MPNSLDGSSIERVRNAITQALTLQDSFQQFSELQQLYNELRNSSEQSVTDSHRAKLLIEILIAQAEVLREVGLNRLQPSDLLGLSYRLMIAASFSAEHQQYLSIEKCQYYLAQVLVVIEHRQDPDDEEAQKYLSGAVDSLWKTDAWKKFPVLSRDVTARFLYGCLLIFTTLSKFEGEPKQNWLDRATSFLSGDYRTRE